MPYQRMSPEQVHGFLAADPPHTGKLATVRKDGRPHVAPVWFAVDGEGPDADLLFCTGRETVKGRNLLRDGRAALCVDDERPPFSFVTVEGPVELIEDLDEVLHWATVIGGRYMGADQADDYGRRNAVPGELLVRLRQEKVASAQDLAD